MGFDQIIALDLGKFKSVVCFMDARTRTHRFETAATTPAPLHDLLVTNAGHDASRTVVVFETCDCAGWARRRRQIIQLPDRRSGQLNLLSRHPRPTNL